MIELRDRIISIVLLLLRDFVHIEVCLTEELAGLKLLRLLDVHTPSPTCLCLYEIAGSLTAYPACGHISNLRARNKTIHILIEVDRGTVTVDGHTFL